MNFPTTTTTTATTTTTTTEREREKATTLSGLAKTENKEADKKSKFFKKREDQRMRQASPWVKVVCPFLLQL